MVVAINGTNYYLFFMGLLSLTHSLIVCNKFLPSFSFFWFISYFIFKSTTGWNWNLIDLHRTNLKTKYKTKNRNQRNLVCQEMNGIIGWSNVMISMKNMQQKYENQWMQQSHKSINVYNFLFLGLIWWEKQGRR